jgi:hypothetical protein
VPGDGGNGGGGGTAPLGTGGGGGTAPFGTVVAVVVVAQPPSGVVQNPNIFQGLRMDAGTFWGAAGWTTTLKEVPQKVPSFS